MLPNFVRTLTIRICAACLLTACLGDSARFVSTAAARYRYDAWTTDEGLPQNTISAILQTRDGYLWFTTLDGLVRYDGVRFAVFDKGNTKGINTNRFHKLCEDGAGDLWAGTEDGGLIRYRAGVFTAYAIKDGLDGNFIRGIYNDGGNGLLVVGGDGDMVYWRDGRFIPYSPAGVVFGSFSYLGQSGTLWDRNPDGLHSFNNGGVTTWPVRDGTTREPFHGRYESRDGSLWVGTIRAGLQRWQGGRLTVYSTKDGLPNSEVRSFGEDRQGDLWVGTMRGELCRFRDGRFTVELALTDSPILAIYEDREGNLWVGTQMNGLYRLRPQVIAVYTERDGLASNNAYPVCGDRDGNIWIGAGGLNRFKDGVFFRYPKLGGLPRSDVSALHEDREGRLWVGGDDTVGWIKDGKYTDFTAQAIMSSKRDVLAIHQDRAGSLWLGTEYGLYKHARGTTIHYTREDGLASEEVKEIYEDRQGRLWFATYGGLSCFENGRFISYTEEDGLASNRVRTVYEDSDGILWIGTYDGGLSRLQDGRLTTYTTRDGLFNNGVFRIMEDSRGNFWMSCNRGIYRVSRRQLNDFADGKTQVITSVAYGKSDGLDNTECNGGRQPAGWKTPDGRLWFPTQGGVAVIDPEAVPLNPLPPPVMIEGCVLDREAIEFQPAARVAAGKENLEIHYAGLSFIKPEQVRFKYQLVGLDHDWIDAGTRRAAYYSYLPPGTYTFRVIAANSDGVWNTEGASIQITVIPPFWKTWWFVTLAVLGVAGAMILLFERRVMLLKRARAAQEAFSKQLIASQENERKRIAAELHDSLNQSLVIIKNRAVLSLNAPEDREHALEQMEEIADAATQAIDEVREIAYNLRPYQLDRLGLTRSIESMLRKASAADSLRFVADLDTIDGVFAAEAEINFYRIVQESVNNVMKHSGATEAKVTIRKNDRALELTIQDNGKGFPAQAVVSADAPRRGFGLVGIAERARMLGGAHLIESAPGQGTTIRIRIGLKDGRHEP